jgi:hypothetical protein
MLLFRSLRLSIPDGARLDETSSSSAQLCVRSIHQLHRHVEILDECYLFINNNKPLYKVILTKQTKSAFALAACCNQSRYYLVHSPHRLITILSS